MKEDMIACQFCGTVNLPSAATCQTCKEPLTIQPNNQPAALAPETVLNERYRIRKIVGRGGFGSVYKAEDLRLGGRLVAVKEMRQRGQTDAEARQAAEAFQKEAHLLASLKHPSLPATHDYFGGDRRWYLVMEFIDGETLAARLERTPEGRLPVAEVLQIGIQLCNVLTYLHDHQPPIIFRDLKPANIMIRSDNTVCLIDFGIARHFKAGKLKDTVLFGSPGYAAPEQYGRAQTAPQSDIYSLGTTLHQLLSGEDPTLHPFIFAPLQLPNLPELGPLVLQMVQNDVSKRPASAAEVARQLRRIATNRPAPQTTNLSLLTKANMMMTAVPCPICSRQHHYQLKYGYQNVLCQQDHQPFTVLFARAKTITPHTSPLHGTPQTYQLQVILPNNVLPVIEFQSEAADVEVQSGDLMIVVYHGGQVRALVNAANSHILSISW